MTANIRVCRLQKPHLQLLLPPVGPDGLDMDLCHGEDMSSCCQVVQDGEQSIYQYAEQRPLP